MLIVKSSFAQSKEKSFKYGFVDQTGKEIVPCKYDGISAFENGFAVVQLKGKSGVVDKTGKEVIRCIYDEIINQQNWIIVNNKNAKTQYLVKSSDVLLTKKYDEAKMLSPEITAVKLNNKWGFIDVVGEEISPKYDEIIDFADRFAVVKLNGKFGIVDQIGKEIVPAIYDHVQNFKEGFAVVDKIISLE